MRQARVALLGGLLATTGLSVERFGLGFQTGLVLPVGMDLRNTTGSSLNLGLGLHARWTVNGGDDLRARVDGWSFRPGQQEVTGPLGQRIDTKVQGVALGVEYLFCPDGRHGRHGRWAAGGGAYLIRWSVDSTNQVTLPPAGTIQASGTSHWTRAGLGLVVTYQVSSKLEAETRWISSRYGYENLPARVGTLGFLWRF